MAIIEAGPLVVRREMAPHTFYGMDRNDWMLPCGTTTRASLDVMAAPVRGLGFRRKAWGFVQPFRTVCRICKGGSSGVAQSHLPYLLVATDLNRVCCYGLTTTS